MAVLTNPAENRDLYLEQFAHCVVDFTSKYNNATSLAYGPDNLIGANTNYPYYGDFEDTYSLKCRWKDSKAKQKNYMSHDKEEIETEDYVIVRYSHPVCPTNIFVYETFNPGAIVRLWGRKSPDNKLYREFNRETPWYLLFEGLPGYNGPKGARKFTPPINKICNVIDEVKIDFSQVGLDRYHTSIDAVLLCGFLIQTDLQLTLFRSFFTEPTAEMDVISNNYDNSDDIDIYNNKIPDEVLLHIFRYLDFKSLGRCARVSKRWRDICVDSSLFYEISLKKYWHKVNDETIEYFLKRCTFVKKLDLSWCNYGVSESKVIRFLETCCQQLTHLSFCNCHFVGEETLKLIGKCSELTDLRLRSIGTHADPYESVNWFRYLSELNQLVALDLSYTFITGNILLKILSVNPNLEHLLLESCDEMQTFDSVMWALANHNPRLVTLNVWKAKGLSSDSFAPLSQCQHLEELDLGWCMVMTDPGLSLSQLAAGCPNLKRLILSGWRGISDHLLLPLIRSCKHLRQLDLLGIKIISDDIVQRILDSLPELEMLDLSFCRSITDQSVENWRLDYSNVAIHRSCEKVYHSYDGDMQNIE